MSELTRYKRPENALLMPDDSGEFVLYEKAEAELTRLRGEVESLRAAKLEIYRELRDELIRAETAEAQLAELRAKVRPSVEALDRIEKQLCDGMNRHCWNEAYRIARDALTAAKQAGF